MKNIFNEYIELYSLKKNKNISYLKKEDEINAKIFLKLQIPLYYFYDSLNILFNKFILKHKFNSTKMKILPYSFCNNNIQTNIYYYLQYIGLDIQKYYIFNDFNTFNIKYPLILKKFDNDFQNLMNLNLQSIISLLLVMQYLITEMNNIIYKLISNKLNLEFKKDKFFIVNLIDNNIDIYNNIFNDIFSNYEKKYVEVGALYAIKIFDTVLTDIYKNIISKKSLAICAK